MTLGDKIKQARLARGMTQSELCDGGITRNMLSQIENGTATPSLETLEFISHRLDIPTGYLLSDEYDTQLYLFHAEMNKVRELFREKKYRDCISLLDKEATRNDEVHYILAYSHFYVGMEYFAGGSMQSAAQHFSLSIDNYNKTAYDTLRIETSIMLYKAVCDNVSLPLLNFDKDAYLSLALVSSDLEFFKYLTQDTEYEFKNERYGEHMRAKRLIKERRYEDAAEILSGIEESRRNYPPNAYLMLSVYTDLESCYKNLLDFEKAYKYSSKRISLMEGFSS